MDESRGVRSRLSSSGERGGRWNNASSSSGICRNWQSGQGVYSSGGRGAPHASTSNNYRQRRSCSAALDKSTLISLTKGGAEPAEIIRALDPGIHDLLVDHGNDFDYLELLFVALGEFCKKNGCTQFTDGFVGVIQSLANKKIFAQVPSVLLSIPSAVSLKQYTTQERLDRFLTSVYRIASDMLVVMPNFACNFLGKNFFIDIMAMKSMPSIQALDVNKVFESLEPGNVLLQDAWEQNVSTMDTTNRTDKRELENQVRLELALLHKPPNDFRTLNITPNMEDMFGDEEPFLRPNIVKGQYPDAATYLDIQFRLLREDFFEPLRTGLKAYVNRNDSYRQTRRMENVRFYHGVKITGYATDTNSHTIYFPPGSAGRINWETSKRLIHGSLLVLSSDGFKSFLLFVVADRQPQYLEIGLFKAKFEGDALPKNYSNETYVMAESTIFFEAYRSVLSALQKISPLQFPMKDYILGHSVALELPGYLAIQKEEVRYDLSDPDNVQNVPDETSENEKSRGSVVNKDKDEILKIPILVKEKRPSAAKLGLDDSQHAAYFAALTQKVSVIQGPPGTGKTYLGLRIVRTLLVNKQHWNAFQPPPILVICYTNHALDQFLEGIAKFTKDIARVGGQSKCEALARFSLYEWKKRNCFVNHDSRAWVFETHNSIQAIYKKLEELKGFVSRVKNGTVVLNETSLLRMGVMSWEMKLKFASFRELAWNPRTKHSRISLWLGLDNKLERLRSHSDVFDRLNKLKKLTDASGRIVAIETKKETLQETPVEDDGWEKEDIDQIKDNRLVVEAEDEDVDFTKKGNIDENELIRKLNIDLRDLSEAMESAYDLSEEMKFIESLKEDLNSCGGYRARSVAWKLREEEWFVDTLKRLVRESPAASEMELRKWTENGLDRVTSLERWMIYSAWKKKAVEYIEGKMSELEKKGQALVRHLAALRDKESAEACRYLDVVGLTTTGASKHRAFVDHLKPKIVVVEEAAEVLEAHIVTSLSPSCEQLILIGDHQQLRPPVSVYKLAKDYQLDVSLFERLIRNGMKPSILGVQHRMRPEIARLIVPAIYPTLENHSSVLEYPKVKGLAENIFFLSHTEQESADHDGRSHLNVYEADMCLALARYLLLQGYKPEQITILTTYSGQLLHLRKLRKDQALLRPIRISVVDNFQGEENDIIILSLVRSNPDESIGFLRIDNRICVALSRAKQGFYVFGNMQMLQGKSNLWQEISNILSSNGQLGPEFPLLCKKHNKLLKVSKYTQFPPEGGCFEVCSEVMKCGHKCPKLCHGNHDPKHSEVKCKEKCSKTCPEGHPCPKLCKDECPPCDVKITKLLPCTHQQETFCHKSVEQIYCRTVLWKVLPACGHGLDLPCGADPAKVKCTQPCGKLLDCGHACSETCHATDRSMKHIASVCRKPCQRTCPKQHPCLKKCYEKCDDCSVVMTKALPCGHEMKLSCFKDPAEAYCRVKVVKNLTDCQHTAEMDCGASTEGFKCQQPCDKLLCADGHPCRKKCYEPCGVCYNKVERKLNCGHAIELKCSIDPAKVKCRKPKETKLPACGHRASIMCGDDPATAQCSMKCEVRLECGHTCVNHCHANNDPDHESYVCRKPCARFKKGCKMNHKCGRQCHEECPPCSHKWKRTLPCGHQNFTECKYEDSEIPCRITVKKTIPDCGHEVLVECSHEPTRLDCKGACQETLECGHKCTKRCCEPCNASNCKQLVATSFTGICGHTAKVPCTQLKEIGEVLCEEKKDELLLTCPEPCTGILDCGHPCRGTCGNCFNGRVHVSCEQPCGRTLICGHSCKVSCASSCPPCRQVCEQRCVHSKCRHICGEPCSACQEPCPWRCEHFKCTNRCGSFCNRPMCHDSCKKFLKCGHPCVGLCGELCPPLCRVCHRDELTEIHFGNEANEDAKFVFLPDCGHCIEVDAMDHWMSMDDNGEIKPKCCPRCKSVIYSCLRYGNIIKQVLQDVSIVKRRILNEQTTFASARFFESSRTKCEDLRRCVESLSSPGFPQFDVLKVCIDESLSSMLDDVLRKNKRVKHPPLSEEKRLFVEVNLDFFTRVVDILTPVFEGATGILRTKRPRLFSGSGKSTESVRPLIPELAKRLLNRLKELVKVFVSLKRLTAQGYTQVLKEMDRINYIREYYVLQSMSPFEAKGSASQERKVLDKLLMLHVRVLTDSEVEQIKKSLKSLAEKLNTGIGITAREQREILSAMQLSKGHWYKCPNGHIYAIGECGGAMVESRCNECQAPIGGTHHRLLASNSSAPEMDGATRSARPS